MYQIPVSQCYDDTSFVEPIGETDSSPDKGNDVNTSKCVSAREHGGVDWLLEALFFLPAIPSFFVDGFSGLT